MPPFPKLSAILVLCHVQITIVLFSFEGPESVYVDEMWRARAVGGDTVVVAQSEPRHDTAPPLTCGGRAVSIEVSLSC